MSNPKYYRRRSRRMLLIGAIAAALIGATWIDAARQRDAAQTRLDAARSRVAELGLSDLALFTEARYTRHYSQADLHSAFQDHPVALEHFPSGSLLPPRHREQWQ
ncbi:MAG: hypothetical protein ACFCUG_05370 [Thiotrichales bacterium]